MSETLKCPCRVCEGEVSNDTNVRQTNELIAERGWTVVGVGEDDDDLPDWAYTVGLWHTHRLPELSIFGLDVEDMMEWLNEAADSAVAGQALVDGQPTSTAIEDFGVVPRLAHSSWYPGLFGVLRRFYRGADIPMLELIWPDRDGRYPWDEGVRARCREWQPRLWIPLESHNVGPWSEIAAVDPS